MIKDIPSSNEEGKQWIHNQVLNLKSTNNIKRVLDIGCGSGTYFNYFKSILPDTEWTGVEIWEPYINEYNLDKMYDNVIISDASIVDYSQLGEFDIVFVGDVLEHMEEDKAKALIHDLVNISKYLFISIPIVYYPSEHYEFNPYLRHIKPDWDDSQVCAEFDSYIFNKQLGREIGTYLLSKNHKIKTTQIDKTYYFLGGMPRSGSTVISAILNQHPDIFVTPTSPLLDQLISNQNIWHNLQTVKANPTPVQLDNLTRRLINGMWQHVPENIIIDKNRGWAKNLPATEILFGQKIKMIAMVRDLPSIMASWLTLLRKNPNNYLDKQLLHYGKMINDYNRMDIMYNEMVKDCLEGIHCAIKDAGSNLLLIQYDDLINNPQNVMSNITDFLNLDKYSYDFNNISNLTNDDDLSAWGLNGMHTIRSKLEKIGNDPISVLGRELYEKYTEIERSFNE